MQFTLQIDPPRTTMQEHKVRTVGGKPIFYEPTALRQVRTLYREALQAHRPEHPLEGPLRMRVTWLYAPPKASKKKRPYWKTTRPDLDNAVKLLADCMTSCGFWHDDAQIAWLELRKSYAERPGIRIRIESLVVGCDPRSGADTLSQEESHDLP